METRHSVETHLRAMERDAMNAVVPLGEMFQHSRNAMEKGFAAFREESMELLNRLHDRNGEALAGCAQSRDLATFAAAQEKWFADFSREVYESSMRMQEAARTLLAESFEHASHTIRNGHAKSETVEKAADEAENVRRAAE